MKLLHTVVILTLLVLNRVVANQCQDGTIPFILGEKDHTIMHHGGKIPYMNTYWRRTFRNGRSVRVKALKDTDTMEAGYQIGWKIVENTNPVEVVGIGAANNRVSDYTHDDEGLIQGNEGLEIQFARYIVTGVTVGVILLNQGETLRWKAILDGNIVQEGTVSGTTSVYGDPLGKIDFDIFVHGGFEKLVFGVDNGSPNTEYLLEYIEGCYWVNSSPVTGPVCTGPTGRFSGDPHITTYEGLKFDCQGRGEFVIAKNAWFHMQGRFVLGGNTDKKVTVTKGVVFQTPGAPKIQAVVPDSLYAETCPYTFFVNDIERDIRTLGTGFAITAVFSGKSVLFHHPTTGARIEITVKKSQANGCVMAAQVCMPPDEPDIASIVGLLGTPMGGQGDDWTMPNGTVANVPATAEDRRFKPAFDYCTTWCVGQQDSMFTYGDGSYSDYNQDCLGPYDDTLEQEMANIPREIINICGDPNEDEENLACCIDGVVGGTEDANAFMEVEELLDELKADPPLTSLETRLETVVVVYIAGDPHIRTWGGDNYDFNGVCDLLLLKNPDFKEGLGMDIQVRSKKYNRWAYISLAVLRIGEDTLEVSGRRDEHGNSFWINGVAADSYDVSKVAKDEESVLLPHTISGHPISFTWVSDKHREFEVGLGNNQQIVMKTWNDFVRVDIVGAKASDFGSSLGLMGTYPNGIKVARDGKTIINDSNEFGMEWQVLNTEPILFHNMEGPQAPEKCAMPMATDMRRRLGASAITFEEAKEACSRVGINYLDICIFDVMATNDIEIAGVYEE